MNTTLICILVVNLALTLFIVTAFLIIRSVFRRMLDTFTDFVTAPDEKTPSKLALTVDAISKTAGHSIALEVKTVIMGKASGIQRNLIGLESDIANDSLNNSNPVAGGLLDMMPSVKKRLLKNPDLMGFVLSKLGGISPNTGSNHGNNEASSSPKFKL